MRPLLDAHTLVWAVDDPSRLGPQAVIELKNTANQLLLSAGTLWELAIKVGQKKLSLSLPYRHWMAKAIADLGLKILPITVDYAEVQASLPRHHGDPFDRLLVAQAMVETVPIISADAPVRRRSVPTGRRPKPPGELAGARLTLLSAFRLLLRLCLS
jgi:PIN domain nuclease of toxin-antitoxin system